jgi:hypothetical protein
VLFASSEKVKRTKRCIILLKTDIKSMNKREIKAEGMKEEEGKTDGRKETREEKKGRNTTKERRGCRDK